MDILTNLKHSAGGVTCAMQNTDEGSRDTLFSLRSLRTHLDAFFIRRMMVFEKCRRHRASAELARHKVSPSTRSAPSGHFDSS